MLVFSVETSCDETSVCIMKEDKTILSHIVYSQTMHTKHGGVVTELASRAHLDILQQITKEALKESGLKLNFHTSAFLSQEVTRKYTFLKTTKI